MSTFTFSRERIDAEQLRSRLTDPAAGGYASFEGWVRNHNDGLPVRHLEYEAFEQLAVKEGERIVAEALARFGVEHAACVHRIGDLAIGEMAVWVGVSSRHRHEAFLACRYIIDEVKHRVPIWKKEHYGNGDSGWVNCERCATPWQEHRDGDQHAHRDADQHAHRDADQHAHRDGRGPEHSADQATAKPDYSRQMTLKEVGATGQAKLRASAVLVVGCGGLGVPVISYLAGAGIGRLGLLDSDRLEASNLHRQTLYSLGDVGQPKAELAAARVRALNPEVNVSVHAVRLEVGNAAELIAPYDLVVDCTDNFTTKFLLNDQCVHLGKPVIFASVYQYEGQLQVVRPDRDGACLRCVWPEATRDGLVGNCAEAGVLGPVPGVFGSLQAFEALKVLLDLPGQSGNAIVFLDLLTLSMSRVTARRASSCPQHAIARLSALPPAGDDVEVSYDSLDEACAAGFEVIDIREARECSELPIPCAQARHTPMAQLLYGQAPFVATGRSLLVCASGRRSLAAAQELRSRGQTAVYSLKGGISALADDQGRTWPAPRTTYL